MILRIYYFFFFFFSSRRRHTRSTRDWSSDVCSSDLAERADVSSLRTAFYGASPMPRPLLEQVLGLWGHRLVQYYGQTEAPLAITVLDADDHRDPALLG